MNNLSRIALITFLQILKHLIERDIIAPNMTVSDIVAMDLAKRIEEDDTDRI